MGTSVLNGLCIFPLGLNHCWDGPAWQATLDGQISVLWSHPSLPLELGGQIRYLDHPVLREHHRSLNDILQLTNIARPRIPLEQRLYLCRKPRHGPVGSNAVLRQKMRHKQGHIPFKQFINLGFTTKEIKCY